MLNALLETHLCRYMSGEEAQWLLDVGSVRIVPRDTVIFAENDSGGSMFAILMGYVKILKRNPLDADEVLAVLSAGDIIGEMSVIDSDIRSATAVSASEVTLFELDRKSFLGFMKIRPSIAVKLLWAILETVSMRLRSTHANYQTLLAKHLAFRKGRSPEIE